MDTLPIRLQLHRSNLQAHTLYKLLNHFGSAASVLSASYTTLKEMGLNESSIQRLLTPDEAAIEKGPTLV